MPPGAVSWKRVSVDTTCQKAANDSFGGTERTCAGVDTEIVVSVTSILGLFANPVHKHEQDADVVEVEVGLHISTALTLNDLAIGRAVEFATLTTDPIEPRIDAGVIAESAKALAAT